MKFISHEEGRVVTKGGVAEYQYFLKDHLGNVRVTFTSVQTPVTNTAGFESANTTTESTAFQNYPTGANLVMNAGFAHAGIYSERLTGGANSQVGLTKSFSVVPGDIVSISAYGKYAAPTSTAGNITGFATALLNAFGLTTPAAGETGTPSSAINAYGAGEAAGHKNGSSDTGDPLAFVTILMFDKNYNFLDASYSQLTSAAQMIATYTAKQPGYAYLYISNEQTYQTDVYFDDVVVTFTPSPVVQLDDYYPFGLTFNSYLRKSIVPNNYQFNGKELQIDLSLNWLDFGARMNDPAIGKWLTMDPLGEKYLSFSPYVEMANNPLVFIDPNGEDLVWAKYRDVKRDPELSKQFSSRREYRSVRSKAKTAYNKLVKESPTAKAMFDKLDQAKEVHTIYATKDYGSTTTAKKGDVNGTDMKIGMAGDETTNMTSVAHEGAHAYRMQEGMDSALPTISLDNPSFSEVADYNRARENGERGASHIENIIIGELRAGGRKVDLKGTYRMDNATYNLDFKTGRSSASWSIKELNLLDGNPYSREGYINHTYNLSDIQQ